ncbi:MAG: Trm112 family protein [Anaerolineae bacterium]
MTQTVSSELLGILRCPEAVHYTDKGDDPGKLELVRDGHWLACADSGYKYPIREGIPVMLIEEGQKWKDTVVDDLPVPPPAE